MLTPAQEQLIRAGVMAVNRLSGLIEKMIEQQGAAAPQFMDAEQLAERYGVTSRVMREWLAERGFITANRVRCWSRHIKVAGHRLREVAEIIDKEGGIQLRDGSADRARAKQKRGSVPVVRRSAPPSGD